MLLPIGLPNQCVSTCRPSLNNSKSLSYGLFTWDTLSFLFSFTSPVYHKKYTKVGVTWLVLIRQTFSTCYACEFFPYQLHFASRRPYTLNNHTMCIYTNFMMKISVTIKYYLVWCTHNVPAQRQTPTLTDLVCTGIILSGVIFSQPEVWSDWLVKSNTTIGFTFSWGFNPWFSFRWERAIWAGWSVYFPISRLDQITTQIYNKIILDINLCFCNS